MFSHALLDSKVTSYQPQDFDFDLPQSLIARYPLPDRSASRLLCVDKQKGAITDAQFAQLPDLLQSNDLLIFNNTKVIPARLYGVKASGGKVECLLERILDSQRALVHLRASKSLRVGSQLFFSGCISATVLARRDDLFELEFSREKPLLEWLQQYGEIPLPPYLEREPEESDRERYQTVYAQHEGAVAAPTAGLHFDEALLQRLVHQKIPMEYLTLHVGAGTFQPIKVDLLEKHVMHTERMEVPISVCEAVYACKARGGRVIAVGTTVVRALESAARHGSLEPYQGETNIFIYPGYSFQVVDALITNFHLPRSTLLMLVCALGGYEPLMKAYQHAIAQEYRFYSYGDAMFIS